MAGWKVWRMVRWRSWQGEGAGYEEGRGKDCEGGKRTESGEKITENAVPPNPVLPIHTYI